MSENRWQKENFVFRLKSPLHIGYMPFKGSVVSPTRYYVPGRNFWGAVTKRVTEHLCEKNHREPKADDYKEIGEQVMENFRFSYFYIYDGKTIYLPHYTDKGMKYGNITKAEFEHRLIGCIVSTGIEDETRTAKDKSLHEIEFINSRFRDENGNIKPVMIAGCIWIKKDAKIEVKRDKNKTYPFKKESNGIFIDDFNIISELILGGESKYGFGHVVFDSVDKVEFPIEIAHNNKKKSEGKDDDHEKYCIKVKINKDKPLIAHLRYDRKIKFKGDVELLTGRGYYDPLKLKNGEKDKNHTRPGEVISRPVYYFSPGTVLKENGEKQEKSIICRLNWDGTLERCSNEPY